jgi:hypothetical protein
MISTIDFGLFLHFSHYLFYSIIYLQLTPVIYKCFFYEEKKDSRGGTKENHISLARDVQEKE